MQGTKGAWGVRRLFRETNPALSSGPVPFVLFKGACPTRAHKAGLVCHLNDSPGLLCLSFSCLNSFMSYDAGTLLHFPISQ